MQLWHCGRVSHYSMLAKWHEPLPPLRLKPLVKSIPMKVWNLMKHLRPNRNSRISPVLLNNNRHARVVPVEAGFDGVEIPCCGNGYLLVSFCVMEPINVRINILVASIENELAWLWKHCGCLWNNGLLEKSVFVLSPLQPFNDLYDSNPEATFSYVVKALINLDWATYIFHWDGRRKPGRCRPVFWDQFIT